MRLDKIWYTKFPPIITISKLTKEAQQPYFTIIRYYPHIYSTIPCQLFSNIQEYWEENWHQMNDMHAS